MMGGVAERVGCRERNIFLNIRVRSLIEEKGGGGGWGVGLYNGGIEGRNFIVPPTPLETG